MLIRYHSSSYILAQHLDLRVISVFVGREAKYTCVLVCRKGGCISSVAKSGNNINSVRKPGLVKCPAGVPNKQEPRARTPAWQGCRPVLAARDP